MKQTSFSGVAFFAWALNVLIEQKSHKSALPTFPIEKFWKNEETFVYVILPPLFFDRTTIQNSFNELFSRETLQALL